MYNASGAEHGGTIAEYNLGDNSELGDDYKQCCRADVHMVKFD